jgi:hypothetical protein
MQDTIRTGLIGETVVHGPGAPAHLPESPFHDIGGADGFPALWRKVIKVQAVFPIKIIYMVFIYLNTIGDVKGKITRPWNFPAL